MALETLKNVREIRVSTTAEGGRSSTLSKKLKIEPGTLLPEEDVYLSILEQVRPASGELENRR